MKNTHTIKLAISIFFIGIIVSGCRYLQPRTASPDPSGNTNMTEDAMMDDNTKEKEDTMMEDTSTGDPKPVNTNNPLQGNSMTDVDSLSLSLAEENASGVSGTAVFSINGRASKVVVTTTVSRDNSPTIIHNGSCDSLGDPKYTLNTIVGSRSESVVPVPLNVLLRSLPLALAVHESPEDFANVIACSNIEVN